MRLSGPSRAGLVGGRVNPPWRGPLGRLERAGLRSPRRGPLRSNISRKWPCSSRLALLQRCARENLLHAWYEEGAADVHPFDRTTRPTQKNDIDYGGKYSWATAVRHQENGRLEAGPLGYDAGIGMVRAGYAQDLRPAPQRGDTVAGRSGVFRFNKPGHWNLSSIGGQAASSIRRTMNCRMPPCLR